MELLISLIISLLILAIITGITMANKSTKKSFGE